MEKGHVLLCGTGSIASIKLPGCASALMSTLELPVNVVLTRNALHFTTQRALRGMGCERVWVDEFQEDTENGTAPHVMLTETALLVVVYPATANFIAKMAHGIADDLAASVVLTAECPVLIVPTMHIRMWRNLATAQNIDMLEARGHRVLPAKDSEVTSERGITFSVDEVVKAAKEIVAQAYRCEVL